MDIEPEELFNNLSTFDSTERRTLKNEEGLGSPMVPTVPNENGFAPEFHGLLGVETIKPRVSLLQDFDPLYENSPIKERLLKDDIIDENAEVFNTPLTSPHRHLGNTTQIISLQESFSEGTIVQPDETSVSPRQHSINSVTEGTYLHSILVPSIAISTSNSHSPTSDDTESVSNSDLIPSEDIESTPNSEKPADSVGISLDNTIILSDRKSDEFSKQVLGTDRQEYFDSHSTLSDLQKLSNDDVEFNNVVDNPNSGFESFESSEQNPPISIDLPPNEVQTNIHSTSLNPSDSTQLETSSSGNESLPDLEENSCQKNETSGIECLSVSKESGRTKEVEVHCDVSVLNKTVITEGSVDGFPLKESVDIPALPVSNIDTEALKSKMADLSEDLAKQQQENSELRLQLNALQQARASLELEVRQKEEIIIKSQAEALKIEQKYKQEIKTLKEKVKENSTLIEKDDTHNLQEQLKEAQLKEAKLTADLQARIKLEEQHAKIMEEFDRTLQHRFDEYEKLKEKYEVNKTHLANLELAFSDVHSKYEKSKESLQTLLLNEEALIVKLDLAQATNNQHEERYESLRQHAGNQIDKSNKELLAQRERYESEISKLKAIIKRLEIKCSSLEISLQQKVEECEQLAALCDEVTGKKI